MPTIKIPVTKNKSNNQLSLFLPRTKLDFLKRKDPKFININIKEGDFEW